VIASFFGLVVSFSTLIALIAFRERQNHRFRCCVAVLSAFVICFLTATKGGPAFLILGLLSLQWMETRKLNLKGVLATVVVFIGIVAAIEFYVHVNGESIIESLVPVGRSAALYISSPIVAFDRIVEHPNIVHNFNPPYDVLKRMSNKFFRTKLEVSQQIPDFLSLGPYDLEGNTYTFYGGWFYFGALEAVLAVGLVGFLSALVFYRALNGGAVSAILYAVLVSGLCFMPYTDYISSIFVDCFTASTAWMIYYLPIRIAQFRAFNSVAVDGYPKPGV
jgi:oligosaccharide repeat unit polymerase